MNVSLAINTHEAYQITQVDFHYSRVVTYRVTLRPLTGDLVRHLAWVFSDL